MATLHPEMLLFEKIAKIQKFYHEAMDKLETNLQKNSTLPNFINKLFGIAA